jgi:Zn-dependent protease
MSAPAPRTSAPGGIFLGRVLGIELYLDYSWFLIAALITFSLSQHVFPTHLPGLSIHAYIALAVLAMLLFFASLLLHELGHSVVSQREGIPVHRITLLFIGGIAELSKEPTGPRAELKIALGGPVVTLLLVFLFGIAGVASAAFSIGAAAVLFAWLCQVNLALLIFNAIPGYPLDGGRVLRALLWLRSGNLRRATYLSSRAGVAFSWVLIAFSIWLLMLSQWNAFLFLFIAFFLRHAAEAGYAQTVQEELLAGVRVRDIMTKEPVTIPATLPANLAVDDYFLASHHLAFPVCDEDRAFRGLLRLDFLKRVPREKWPFTSVLDIAIDGGGDDLKITAEESASEAMKRLLQPTQGRLAVLEDGKVVGIITRHDVLQFMQVKTALEAEPA